MIKGWRINPSWVAYRETIKGFREIRRQQRLALSALDTPQWPYPTTPSVAVDIETLFPDQIRSH